MDNFKLHFVGDTSQELETAIKLGFSKFKHAVGWQIKDNTLYLYWHIPTIGPDSVATKLPFNLTAQSAIPFISGWLSEYKPTEPYPGIDGSVGIGFEIQYCGGYEFLSVRPIWALYGK